jgi:precorrin-6Y C5,15-methyltransferase (decarboxylating)
MSHPVAIVGTGADGLSSLSARARALVDAATWIAGGRRHLDWLSAAAVETFTIADNVTELIDRLDRRGPDERCVVLASGDPLFYGIGHRLSEALGEDQLVVEPSISSLQVAFARAGVSWQDAAIASVHGRPLARTLIPLLGRPKIGLFSHDGSSPSAIAAFFHERGLEHYHAWVGERLGTPDERVTSARLSELRGRVFDPLNVVVLVRGRQAPPVGEGQGARLGDSEFARPETGPVMLTHADVRAMVIARFEGLPDGPIWDLGAGVGGVSVSLARTFPDREIIAVERSSAQAAFLRINRARFGTYNIRVLEGEAPERVSGEEPPAAIFLGGTGGRLETILSLTFDRLLPGGIVVANFVGLENLARTMQRMGEVEWRTEVAQIQVSHGQNLGGLTTLMPQRPVWIVKAVSP